MRRVRLGKTLQVAVLLLAAAATYSPGLGGPFLFDDFMNLVEVPAIAMDRLSLGNLRNAAFAEGKPYPNRGIARASFALNYYLAGGRFDSFAFKLTNLAIHLLNGVLVYLLSSMLLRRYAGEIEVRGASTAVGWSAMQSYVPLVVCAVWILHPIQLTSVLYVVQRMTSLSALFVFLGLATFMVGRAQLEQGRASALWLMLVGIAGGSALGGLCKENALLLPFLAFLVEVFFFRRQALGDVVRRRLYYFYGGLVALPVLLAAWFLFSDMITGGYVNRDFTLSERLLTQARVLFFYLGLMVLPQVQRFGLFHDDMAISRGWTEPWTTWPSVTVWVLLVVLALWGMRRRSLWSFGVLWYLVAHGMESTVIGLELIHEHRNYVPSFGLALAGVFYLMRALERQSMAHRWRVPILAVLVSICALSTGVRAAIWEDRHTLLELGVRNHPQSARYHGTYAAINTHLGGDPGVSFHHWQRAAALKPSEVLALVEMQMLLAPIMRGGTSDQTGSVPSSDSIEVDPFTTSLEEGFEVLGALDARVAREIATRLKEESISTSTVASLQRLANCIVRGEAQCRPLLDRTLHWLAIAVGNDRLGGRERAILFLGLARLHGLQQQTETAIDYAMRAIEYDPNELLHRLELVKLYLAAADHGSAARAMEAVEALVERRGVRTEEMQALKRRIEQGAD